ncbi:hypothetical protein COOONC_03132 [Cooperia oncophora]
MSNEVDRAVRVMEQLPSRVSEELEEARIASKYREKLFHVIGREVVKACEALEELRRKTNIREVRTVLGEVQRRREERPAQKRRKWKRTWPMYDYEMVTENPENKGIETNCHEDWSTLRTALETAFGTIGRSTVADQGQNSDYDYGTSTGQCM